MVVVWAIFSREVKFIDEPLAKVTGLGAMVAAKMILVLGSLFLILLVMAPRANHWWSIPA